MSVQPASPPAPAPPLPNRLAPPHRPSSPVERPRLLQRLTSAAEAPVFVLRAPAGYGKSTLLAQFVERGRRRVAWLALDERDDDPIVLLHDLAHALRAVAPMDDELLAGLTPGPAAVVPVAAPRLLRWLADLDEPIVIVLDDVHLLVREDTRDVLRMLCDGTPPGTTVVLAGRARAPIALARLRAEGRLAELGAADLRMTPAEGTAMLRTAGAQVEDAEGALVVERTEGWPAAIYLAALMLRGDRDGAGATVLGPAEADLSEYFREEVLADIDPGDADFLVRSSILDLLEPSLCDEVLGREDSAERLRALADADLFVTPADAQGTAFRVHGLFREILQGQLRARGGDQVAELHRRAGAAYLARGDDDRAVRHAVASGDLAAAADTLWAFAPQAISHGRSASVLRWSSWFSESEVVAHPEAALAAGWASLELGDGEAAAHCAAITCAAQPDRLAVDGAPLALHGRLLRATVGEHGIATTLEDARAAAEGFPPDLPVRSIPLYLLGFHALLAGAPDEAAGLLGDAEQLAAGVMPTVYGLALAQQALLAAERDDWGAAERVAGRARAFQRAAGIQEYATQGIVMAACALVEARAGREAAARQAAEQSVRNLALQGAIFRWQAAESRLVLARAWVMLGDGPRARTLRGEAIALVESDPLKLLDRWAAEVQAGVSRLGASGEGPDITTAELRTLQYLPTHLSLREIGERLHVTRNTVKTHTISLYRKLEVTSRSEAVARARELGIVD